MTMTLVLTQPQEQVVAWRGGVLLVFGEAGAGKTEVLARRTRAVLLEGPGGSGKVLGLTFSTQAAAELRSRCADLPEARDRVVVETTHSFSLAILRSHGRAIGVPAEPVVYGTHEDRLSALHLALVGAGLAQDGDDVRNALRPLVSAISRSRASAGETGITWRGHDVAELRSIYDDYLMAAGALDFDLMLHLATALLTDHPRVAALYRDVYAHIHVDEAQDLTVAQWNLLEALWGPEPHNVVLLADPAQSIYGFRGATPGELDAVAERHNADQVDLVASKRCARRVLEIAHPLLHRGATLPSEHAGNGAPGHASFKEFPDEGAEAQAVAQWVERLTSTGLRPEATGLDQPLTIHAQDICVLGRSRRQLEYVVQEFSDRQVEHQLILGDRSLFDTDAFDMAMGAMKLLAAPDDMALAVALLSNVDLQSPVRTGNATSILRLAAAQEGAHSPLLRVLADHERDVEGALDAIAELEPTADEADLFDADRTFLLARGRAHCDTASPGQQSWAGVVRELSSTPRPEEPGVRVSTIHAAKGREFEVVILVGMNEGGFPDFRELDDPQGVESERRLAYVAVTRARHVVVCSRPRRIDVGRGPWERRPSRFLREMGLL